MSGDGELGEQVQEERDGGLGRGAPFIPLTPGEQKQLRQSAQSQGERWLEHRSQLEESFNEPLDFILSLPFFLYGQHLSQIRDIFHSTAAGKLWV